MSIGMPRLSSPSVIILGRCSMSHWRKSLTPHDFLLRNCGPFKSQICKNCLMWSTILPPTQNVCMKVTLFPQNITKRVV